MADTTTTGTDVAVTAKSGVIALPIEDNLPAVFAKENGIKELIAQVEKAARSEAATLDVTTDKNRKAIISLASKVTRSKTAIDTTGAELNAERLKLNKEVNDQRNLAKELLGDLATEIRKPVTEWEAADAARKEKHTDAIQSLRYENVTQHSTSVEIQAALDELAATEVGADVFEEFSESALEAKVMTQDRLNAALVAALDREEKEAELAELRAEKLAREQAEAARAEEEAAAKAEEDRIAKQKAADDAAAAAAALAAKDAELADMRAQMQAQMQAMQDQAAQRERADKAEADKAEADKKAAEEQKAADDTAELEAQELAQRIAAVKAAIGAAILKKIGTDSGAEIADIIAAAIVAGEIPHIEVTA